KMAAPALSLCRCPRAVAAARPLHLGPGSWAGHNRWSKVKNVKGPRDAARSRLFQRLGAMLRTAAREGGPDPSLNAQLANVMEQCRARNMPKATIEAAIGSVVGPGGGSGLGEGSGGARPGADGPS
ncbi:TACO1 oxidase, partial [Brachypteracias leptosomus]|nr:TACO1 oxidase [Brachypteracias leptosomus]